MTDQPVTTRRRAPEARPHQILDAAFHEFGERGLAGARLDDIARRAGIAKGTIYLYFPNKEALFKEMVRSTIIEALNSAEAQREQLGDSPAAGLLRQLATAWWAFLRTPRVSTLHRLAQAELHQFPDLIRFYGDEVITRGRRLIAGIIADGVRQGEFRSIDPVLAARMYSAIWISHAIWKGHPESARTLGSDDEVLEEMLDFYLHALRP